MVMLKAFINSKIYISYMPLRTAEAFIVGDKVIYYGDEDSVLKIANSLSAEIVDLEGKIVLPGFIDCHTHLDGLALYLNSLDLRGVRSIKELKAKLKKYAQEKESQWILGHGWDQELFAESRWPTRWDLDEVVPDKPVMLTRICGHAAVLNTKAMEIFGILNLKSPNILRDKDGEATGIITEDMVYLAKLKVRSQFSINDYKNMLRNALQYAASQGVTMLGFVSCDKTILNALMDLWREYNFPVRVRIYLTPDNEILSCLEKLGGKMGFGDEYLKIMGIKILADGSLGARTAWLSKPYDDDQTTSGAPNISKDELSEIVKFCNELGLQLAIHGIGDKTIDMILDVYSELSDDIRHRIEHASILRNDQIARIKNLGISVSVQPHFIISDWWVVNRVGEERAKYVYPFKSLVNSGVSIGISTDCPVEILNPWATVYAAVTRGKYENIPLYRYTIDECLSLNEALHYYTYGSAYMMHEEERYGSLEVGKYADFIVVDVDPFEVDQTRLKTINILETYVNGKCVYKYG